MTVGRSSKPLTTEPATSAPSGRDGLVPVPTRIRSFAIHEVTAHWSAQLGNPSAAQLEETAACVVAGIHEIQITPGAVIDAPALSLLGQRLVEVMRHDVVTRWQECGLSAPEVPVLLLAMERVRDAIVNRAAHQLVSQLSGTAGLQLLVEVAHDMHSPLASILFLAETIQRGESGPVTDLQRRQLGLICTAALGLSSVGRDIVDLERSDLLLEPKPVPFSVTSVLESVRDIVRPIAEVKGLSVRVEPPTADERLGHPVALRRVLLNLTTNALKFTERGSVELIARESKSGSIEFSVRDTGRGIEPAMMPTLFDPVRQTPHVPGAHQMRGSRLFSNTGLGLAICRKLAEAMGAQMRVETQLGRGTKFFFELALPLSPSRRNSDPERRAQQETSAA
jgi:signal transduction histidine kinase